MTDEYCEFYPTTEVCQNRGGVPEYEIFSLYSKEEVDKANYTVLMLALFQFGT